MRWLLDGGWGDAGLTAQSRMIACRMSVSWAARARMNRNLYLIGTAYSQHTRHTMKPEEPQAKAQT